MKGNIGPFRYLFYSLVKEGCFARVFMIHPAGLKFLNWWDRGLRRLPRGKSGTVIKQRTCSDHVGRIRCTTCAGDSDDFLVVRRLPLLVNWNRWIVQVYSVDNRDCEMGCCRLCLEFQTRPFRTCPFPLGFFSFWFRYCIFMSFVALVKYLAFFIEPGPTRSTDYLVRVQVIQLLDHGQDLLTAVFFKKGKPANILVAGSKWVYIINIFAY